MSIHYGFYETEGLKNAKNELMVRTLTRNLVHSDKLARLIEGRCTLTTADVKAVLDALADIMGEQLLESNRVVLDGIGKFSVSIGGEVKRDKNGRPILLHGRVKRINFRPAPELMGRMSRATFTTRYSVARHSRKGVTDEEVVEAARMLTARQSFFTVRDFGAELGLTSSTAYRRLQPLLKAGTVKRSYVGVRGLYRFVGEE